MSEKADILEFLKNIGSLSDMSAGDDTIAARAVHQLGGAPPSHCGDHSLPSVVHIGVRGQADGSEQGQS